MLETLLLQKRKYVNCYVFQKKTFIYFCLLHAAKIKKFQASLGMCQMKGFDRVASYKLVTNVFNRE